VTREQIIQLIDDEIASLRDCILNHRGVGPYYELCAKWQHYIDGYLLLLDKIKLTVDERSAISESHAELLMTIPSVPADAFLSDLWFDLPTGNAVWRYGTIACTVYLKRGTKASWRWLIDNNGRIHHCFYTASSKKKAKTNAFHILSDLANGSSWGDAQTKASDDHRRH
jgi:hypothetical protein